MAKSKVESRRKNEVIAYRARNGIADVTIAERTLPSQPRIDFCRQTYIEGEAIFAEVAQFGINIQRFADRGVFSDLVAEQMRGTYNFINERVDLDGQLELETKFSATAAGPKGLVTRVVEPLFANSRGKGEILPVKLTGSYDQASYGLDK